MAEPRVTSTDADELAATISAVKSRLNELESASGSGSPPIGTILDYLGEVAPAGWTLLDGTTIINGATLYPALWAVLPNIYKSGNNIVKPDTRGRVLVHRGSSGTLNVNVGSVGGAETVTLSSSEMPVHTHDLANHTHTTPNHTHQFNGYTSNNEAAGFGLTATASFANRVYVSATAQNGLIPSGGSGTTGTPSTNTSGSAGGSGSPATTQAHNNLQPYMVVTKILRLV